MLLPSYLEHRERDVVAIRRALELKDFPTLVRIGHNLRGNARSYGFPELATLGEVLEGAAKERRADEISVALKALEAWLALNRQQVGDDGGGARTPPDGR